MADEMFEFDIDQALRSAADDVQHLAEELDAALDGRQRRLVHELRLAAETLGVLRALSATPSPWPPGHRATGGWENLHGVP